MRHTSTPAILIAAATAGLAVACLVPRAVAGCAGCTGGCQECVPACSGTWDEKKTSKPVYSMKCEYACVRGRDPWHAPPPECRCHPPCGDVIVKKKFYKTDGSPTVERVPKYEVKMVPAEPCDCAAHRDAPGPCWWNPLALLPRLGAWW